MWDNAEIPGNLTVGGTAYLKPVYAETNSTEDWTVPESTPPTYVWTPDPHATLTITLPMSMRILIFVSGSLIYTEEGDVTWGWYRVTVNDVMVPSCERGHENEVDDDVQTEFSATCMTGTLAAGSYTIKVEWFDAISSHHVWPCITEWHNTQRVRVVDRNVIAIGLRP